MTKEYLLVKAKELMQVDEKYATEYAEKRELLVDQMNLKMLGRADIQELVGVNNADMMKDNHANHARFLESIFHQHSPEVLVDTVLWVFRAYRARKFEPTYWSAQLNAWLEVYKEHLSPECWKAVYPYYHWMMTNIPTFNILADKEMDLSNSAH